MNIIRTKEYHDLRHKAANVLRIQRIDAPGFASGAMPLGACGQLVEDMPCGL